MGGGVTAVTAGCLSNQAEDDDEEDEGPTQSTPATCRGDCGYVREIVVGEARFLLEAATEIRVSFDEVFTGIVSVEFDTAAESREVSNTHSEMFRFERAINDDEVTVIVEVDE